MTLRIDYDEKAIDQAAGFLRDDPAGIREVLDTTGEEALRTTLADLAEGHPWPSPYTSPSPGQRRARNGQIGRSPLAVRITPRKPAAIRTSK